jgi:hypothetical protein
VARKRLVLILEILLFAAALLDVTSGWVFLATGAAAVLLGASVFGMVLSRGPMRFAWFVLLAFTFAVHLSYGEYMRYEARNWEYVRARRASDAMQKSLAAIADLASQVSGLAEKAAGDESIRATIEGFLRAWNRFFHRRGARPGPAAFWRPTLPERS